jgi:hypothetical protein
MADGAGFLVACLRVAPPDALETMIAFERDELGVRPDLDRRALLDSADQISRHAFG